MPIPDRLFDADRSFFSLPIVIWTFAVIAICAITACLAIALSTNLTFDFSADGFNTFLKYFQFPLGIVALLIPIMAIYATNHRSVQQKRQIQLASTQNEFANYYKHLEEFQKYYDDCWLRFQWIQMRHGIKPKNYHRLFYKNARFGDYQVDAPFYEKQLKLLESIIDKFMLVDSVNNPAEKFKHFIRGENDIRNFCSGMYLTYYGRVTTLVEGQMIPNEINRGSEPIKNTFLALQESIHFFIYLANFAHKPRYSRLFPLITLIDVDTTFHNASLGQNELTGEFGFREHFKQWDKTYTHEFPD